MSEKLTIGVIYGSDTAHLPESGEGFAGLSLNLKGHNDVPRLIDARVADIVPLLVTPEYLSRDWRYDFGRFDVIFNSLADPDIHASSLLMVISALAGVTTPIVNEPRHIIRTRRDIVAGMLAGLDGLVVPKTVRLSDDRTPSAVVAEHGLKYPLLARSAGSHTGVGLLRLEEPSHLDAAFERGAVTKPAYVTEFVDCRHKDGLYRKMRLVVCHDKVLMRHHLFSDEWLVHAASQKFMESRRDLLDYEAAAAADPLKILPPKGAELITRIKSRVGLDYFGIDCAPLQDGRLAIFEVNAVMNMLPASRHPVRGPFTVAAIGQVAGHFNKLLHERARAKATKPGSAKRPAAPGKTSKKRPAAATSQVR
ncbi:MAG: RimK family alpha-L-glutamate ligase [Reyranellaceae bacterium]